MTVLRRVALGILGATMASFCAPALAALPEEAGVQLERFARGPYEIANRLLRGPSDESAHAKRDHAAALEAYRENDFRPLWIVNGRLTPTAQALVERIARADEDGLDPAAYAVPPADFRLAYDDDKGIADTDIRFTLALLSYGRHAQAGRVEPSSVSPLITMQPPTPDPAALLAQLRAAADPAGYLDGLHPTHPQFLALRAALAEARRDDGESHAPIASGPVLRPGMTDPRVAALRARFDVESQDGETYDAPLVEAVQAFQSRNGLQPDGILGPRTLEALNAGPRDRTAVLLANMERWRWMPRDLGARHVLVDIPGYMVRVVEDGAIAYEGRVVVGKPTNQTPVFSDEMDHVVVNPAWNVPRSIATKEILPQVQANPSHAYRYEVLRVSGGKSVRVDPGTIDWRRYTPATLPYLFRQPPGERNALGRVKFMFPNDHAVYLHDTPQRSLFSRTERAFSHGCVRLHEPLAFADAIARETGWSGARMEKTFGGKQTWINLKTHIPVHLTYFTAWADDEGQVSYRRDIYGHDGRMTKMMDIHVASAD